jgi:hypothetical protein
MDVVLAESLMAAAPDHSATCLAGLLHRPMSRPVRAESAIDAVRAESWTAAAPIHSATCHADLLHRPMNRPDLCSRRAARVASCRKASAASLAAV